MTLVDNWNWDEGKNIGLSASKNTQFSKSFLPIAMKIAAKTISSDLVSVQPLTMSGNNTEEIDRINREIKESNRESKIDSIVNGSEYVEKTNKDHPDYIESKGPDSMLFYLDYSYGSSIGTSSTPI